MLSQKWIPWEPMQMRHRWVKQSASTDKSGDNTRVLWAAGGW